MKPARFEYVRPRDLAHTLEILAENPGAARLLAGGQSLMPLLNMRLASPAILVDINRLTEIRGIIDVGNVIRVGAMTRYRELETSPLITAELPLLSYALRQVAHPAIRNRGTIGGSLAMADPAGEMPACALALDATIIARSVRGERRIEVDDFLRGVWETALEEDEAVVAVEYPKLGPGGRFAFIEFARRQGDFALTGLILVTGGGAGPRCVVFGVGARAFRVPAIEAWLAHDPAVEPAPAEISAALAEAVADAVDEASEGAVRAAMSRTLLVRALPMLARYGGGT